VAQGVGPEFKTWHCKKKKKAEIRRIKVQNQPRQIVPETLSQKNPSQKRAGGMAQAVRVPA
jgi:hypothetical protein